MTEFLNGNLTAPETLNQIKQRVRLKMEEVKKSK